MTLWWILVRTAKPLDDPHLPERPGEVERHRHQVRGQLLQLPVGARRGQGDVADVVVQVEAVVVDPERMTVERRVVEALPVARDEMKARRDVRTDAREVDAAAGARERAGLADRLPADVHRRGGGLEAEEGRILRREGLVEGVRHYS
jgi:hypothetical protein